MGPIECCDFGNNQVRAAAQPEACQDPKPIPVSSSKPRRGFFDQSQSALRAIQTAENWQEHYGLGAKMKLR